MKIGEVLESAFYTDHLHTMMAFDQKMTGMPDPQLDEEPGISFLRLRFKEPAKGIRAHIGHGRYFLQVYLPVKVITGVCIDLFHPVRFVVMREFLQGREKSKIGRDRDCMKDLQ